MASSSPRLALSGRYPGRRTRWLAVQREMSSAGVQTPTRAGARCDISAAQVLNGHKDLESGRKITKPYACILSPIFHQENWSFMEKHTKVGSTWLQVLVNMSAAWSA